MKVYDPAEGIVYVHLAAQVPQRSAGKEHGLPQHLPAGYANQSPRTRVRSDAGPTDSVGALRSVTDTAAADVVPIRACSGGAAASAARSPADHRAPGASGGHAIRTHEEP